MVLYIEPQDSYNWIHIRIILPFFAKSLPAMINPLIEISSKHSINILILELGSYSQVDFNGLPLKRRKIAHLEEDGGCGCELFKVAVEKEVLVT